MDVTPPCSDPYIYLYAFPRMLLSSIYVHMVLSLALLCLTGSVKIWAISKPEQCLALSQDEGALWLGALKQARTASRTQSG